jgi:death-on-curing protein
MLSSALALPRQSYYRTIYDKAGALLTSLIKNHPYKDGNKRMGMALTTVFLLMIGHLLLPASEEMLSMPLLSPRANRTYRGVKLPAGSANARTR